MNVVFYFLVAYPYLLENPSLDFTFSNAKSSHDHLDTCPKPTPPFAQTAPTFVPTLHPIRKFEPL